jgi:hypothetical protein
LPHFVNSRTIAVGAACAAGSTLPVIVVTSAEQGAGKTAVAAAIARHAAYAGQAVRLIRLATATPRSNAAADAAWFGSLFFAPGSPAQPLASEDIPEDPADLVVIEADIADLGGSVEAPVCMVVRDGGAASTGGITPAVTVITRARPGAPGDGVVRIPEDRTLNGFSFEEARDLLRAEVLVEGDPVDTTCDYLVIAPIASDAGQPYFKRFDTKAVVARFDKTDMHLAAMQADPAFLILSGGRRPSEYLFDAASAQGVPVLLSRTDTENTVIALERVWDRTRFTGERKLDRMAALLEASDLFAALGL